MTEVGMRKLVSDENGKLCIGTRNPQEARMNNDLVIGRKGVER
jgi:hypothetical protein